MNENENKNLVAQEPTSIAEYDPNVAYGFEDSDTADVVIPRIKVINALSPERQDGEANEGDVINSLTKERVEEWHFVPIKQYYSCIRWNPSRDADPRMLCRSFDGRLAQTFEGEQCLCKQCGRCEFDNSKSGRDSHPTCTRYINFLGFFEESPMPVVLSFSRTNTAEGRKMLSLAKSMRTAIWGYNYKIGSRLMSKDRNKWYIITAQLGQKTSPEIQTLAFELFNTIQPAQIEVDYEDNSGSDRGRTDAQVAQEI